MYGLGGEKREEVRVEGRSCEGDRGGHVRVERRCEEERNRVSRREREVMFSHRGNVLSILIQICSVQEYNLLILWSVLL